MSSFKCYLWLFVVCLVYSSYSQCDVLYVQVWTVQFNFVSTSFNNTTMNDYIWLLNLVVNMPFHFYLTITSVLRPAHTSLNDYVCLLLNVWPVEVSTPFHLFCFTSVLKPTHWSYLLEIILSAMDNFGWCLACCA